MKELARLLSQIDTWQCSGSSETYPDLDPKIQEINRLFSQMDILHQKLIKFWSRDTLICERVLGILTPTLPGVEFWKTKIRFHPAGHRKTTPATKVPNLRPITLRGKIKGLKKSKDSRWTV